MADASQQVTERINLVYKPNNDEQGEVELPFRALVLGEFTPVEDVDLFDVELINIQSSDIDDLLARVKLTLAFQVENLIMGEGAEPLAIRLPIAAYRDFQPGAIIANVPLFDNLLKLREVLGAALDEDDADLVEMLQSRTADSVILAFIESMGLSLNSDGEVDRTIVSSAIAEIDYRVSKQLDAILHHEEFRRFESAWASLKFLLEQTNFKENIQIELLNVSKEGLLESFEDAPEVTQSPLYHHIYANEFGQFGGRPYSMIVGNYFFGPSAQDVRLLQDIAKVAAISHALFVSGADASFFSIDSYADFSRIRDFDANFLQPGFEKWNGFRETADARYVALTVPRFLLRQNYQGDADIAFDYKETFKKGEDKGLWGNAAFAFATRVVSSYARYRWYINIVGPEHGVVEGLSVGTGRGASRANIPTEVLISDQRESELVKCGFIPLSIHKGASQAAFYAAPSTFKLSDFQDNEEGRREALNQRLGAQLPYLMIVSRFSHYLKVMQREHIGSWKQRSQLDQELNNWLRQYVSDMDNPAPGVRARRPLRKARVLVREVEGKAGWYLINIELTPHSKYMGSSFTLSESGRLDKS